MTVAARTRILAVGLTIAMMFLVDMTAARAASATTTSAPAACALLTANEIARAVGSAVDAGQTQSSSDPTQTACVWITHLSTTQESGLSLLVHAGITKADFAQLHAEGSAEGPTRTIKKIGDEAFSTTVSMKGFASYPDLYVRSGTIAFQLQPPSTGSRAHQLALLEALARDMLPRLQSQSAAMPAAS
jgi:hypothetical protein